MNSKTIITISFLIIALSIAYYLVIFLPTKERNQQAIELQKTDSQQQATEENRQTYARCEKEAGEAATQTLKSKAELLPAGRERTALEEAVEKNMFFKDDYNAYYNNCLKRNGITN